MIRARLLRENGKYLTAQSFAMRRHYFNNDETGYFKTQKRPPVSPNSTAMLSDLVKGNFINVLPMVVIGGLLALQVRQELRMTNSIQRFQAGSIGCFPVLWQRKCHSHWHYVLSRCYREVLSLLHWMQHGYRQLPGTSSMSLVWEASIHWFSERIMVEMNYREKFWSELNKIIF